VGLKKGSAGSFLFPSHHDTMKLKREEQRNKCTVYSMFGERNHGKTANFKKKKTNIFFKLQVFKLNDL
jgi:hypothetical protein